MTRPRPERITQPARVALDSGPEKSLVQCIDNRYVNDYQYYHDTLGDDMHLAEKRAEAPLRSPERIALAAAFLAGAAALAWMLVRVLGACARLAFPPRPTVYPDTVLVKGYGTLDSSLPLFILDNGSVAVADSTGFMAVGGSPAAAAATAWSAAAELTSALTAAVVIAAVLLLCVRLLRGVPFSQGLTRIAGAAGVALVGGAALAQLFGWLSRQSMIAAVAPTVHANGWRLPESGVNVDLVPLACGAVLCLVSLAFSAGDRLRRDTEGLV